MTFEAHAARESTTTSRIHARLARGFDTTCDRDFANPHASPGGHVEPDDGGLMLAALRELEEETGISWHGAVSPPGHDLIPVDIDVHAIPANPNKGATW
jgi:ADP-ribose pyrophosphatase YjhB (NUDIX family)